MTRLDYLKLDKYFFADPASGKSRLKKVRARQAIMGVAVDWLHRIFVIYAWAGRIPTSSFKQRIIDVYEKFQPRLFGIEANAMQELFGDLVRDEAKRKFGTVRIVPVQQPTKIEKEFRIRTTVEPVMFDGRLFVASSERDDESRPIGVDAMTNELLAEISGFPTAATKDMVDALASAISLIPRRLVKKREKEEFETLAEYLRHSGLPGYMIEQRLDEVRRDAGIGR